jgi:hypothetical protein
MTSKSSLRSRQEPLSLRCAGSPDSILQRLFGLGGGGSGGGLDPVNQMPREPNQAPAPGQRRPLPTARQLSSIPKGGTDSAWLYPSPQMFFNGPPTRPRGSLQ